MKITKAQTKWLTSRNIVLIIHHFLHARELMTLEWRVQFIESILMFESLIIRWLGGGMMAWQRSSGEREKKNVQMWLFGMARNWGKIQHFYNFSHSSFSNNTNFLAFYFSLSHSRKLEKMLRNCSFYQL